MRGSIEAAAVRSGASGFLLESHVARLLSKLGLRDRVQAVVFAYENG